MYFRCRYCSVTYCTLTSIKLFRHIASHHPLQHCTSPHGRFNDIATQGNKKVQGPLEQSTQQSNNLLSKRVSTESEHNFQLARSTELDHWWLQLMQTKKILSAALLHPQQIHQQNHFELINIWFAEKLFGILPNVFLSNSYQL